MTVTLREKRWRPVRRSPFTSSPSMRLEAISLARDSMALPSEPDADHGPVRDGLHHEHRHHHDPHQGQGDEDLPAEPHDLVIAVARERRANPEEGEHEERDLGEEPK